MDQKKDKKLEEKKAKANQCIDELLAFVEGSSSVVPNMASVSDEEFIKAVAENATIDPLSLSSDSESSKKGNSKGSTFIGVNDSNSTGGSGSDPSLGESSGEHSPASSSNSSSASSKPIKYKIPLLSRKNQNRSDSDNNSEGSSASNISESSSRRNDPVASTSSGRRASGYASSYRKVLREDPSRSLGYGEYYGKSLAEYDRQRSGGKRRYRSDHEDTGDRSSGDKRRYRSDHEDTRDRFSSAKRRYRSIYDTRDRSSSSERSYPSDYEHTRDGRSSGKHRSRAEYEDTRDGRSSGYRRYRPEHATRGDSDNDAIGGRSDNSSRDGSNHGKPCDRSDNDTRGGSNSAAIRDRSDNATRGGSSSGGGVDLSIYGDPLEGSSTGVRRNRSENVTLGGSSSAAIGDRSDNSTRGNSGSGGGVDLSIYGDPLEGSSTGVRRNRSENVTLGGSSSGGGVDLSIYGDPLEGSSTGVRRKRPIHQEVHNQTKFVQPQYYEFYNNKTPSPGEIASYFTRDEDGQGSSDEDRGGSNADFATEPLSIVDMQIDDFLTQSRKNMKPPEPIAGPSTEHSGSNGEQIPPTKPNEGGEKKTSPAKEPSNHEIMFEDSEDEIDDFHTSSFTPFDSKDQADHYTYLKRRMELLQFLDKFLYNLPYHHLKPVFDPHMIKNFPITIGHKFWKKPFGKAMANACEFIQPTSQEMAKISRLVSDITVVIEHIKRMVDFDLVRISEVIPVGSFAMETMIKGPLTAELVLLLDSLPYKPLLRLLGDKIQSELMKVAQDDELYEKKVEEASITFHLLSQPDFCVRILIATQLSNFRYMSTEKHVSKRAVLNHLRAIDYANFFKEHMRNDECSKMIMLFMDMQRRFKVLQYILPHEVMILCHYCVFWNVDHVALPYQVAYKRIFRLFSSGLLMPYTLGIENPLVRGERIGQRLTMVVRERITQMFQNLLRLTMYNEGLSYVFGFSDSLEKYDFLEGTFLPLPSIYPHIDLDDPKTMTVVPDPELRDVPFWVNRPDSRELQRIHLQRLERVKQMAPANRSAMLRAPAKLRVTKKFYSIHTRNYPFASRRILRGSNPIRHLRALGDPNYAYTFVDDPTNPLKKPLPDDPSQRGRNARARGRWCPDWNYKLTINPNSMAARYGVFAEQSKLDLLLLKRIRSTKNDKVRVMAEREERELDRHHIPPEIEDESLVWDEHLDLTELDTLMPTAGTFMPNQPATWGQGVMRPKWLKLEELFECADVLEVAVKSVIGKLLPLNLNKWPRDAPRAKIFQRYKEELEKHFAEKERKREEAIAQGLPVDQPDEEELEEIQERREKAAIFQAKVAQNMANAQKIYQSKKFPYLATKGVDDVISFMDKSPGMTMPNERILHTDMWGDPDPVLPDDPEEEEDYPQPNSRLVNQLSKSTGKSLKESANIIAGILKNKPVVSHTTNEILRTIEAAKARKACQAGPTTQKTRIVMHNPQELYQHYDYDFFGERANDAQKMEELKNLRPRPPPPPSQQPYRAMIPPAGLGMQAPYLRVMPESLHVQRSKAEQRKMAEEELKKIIKEIFGHSKDDTPDDYIEEDDKNQPKSNTNPNPMQRQQSAQPSPYVRTTYDPQNQPRWEPRSARKRPLPSQPATCQQTARSHPQHSATNWRAPRPQSGFPPRQSSSTTYNQPRNRLPQPPNLFPMAPFYSPYMMPYGMPWTGFPMNQGAAAFTLPPTSFSNSATPTSNAQALAIAASANPYAHMPFWNLTIPQPPPSSLPLPPPPPPPPSNLPIQPPPPPASNLPKPPPPPSSLKIRPPPPPASNSPRLTTTIVPVEQGTPYPTPSPWDTVPPGVELAAKKLLSSKDPFDIMTFSNPSLPTLGLRPASSSKGAEPASSSEKPGPASSSKKSDPESSSKVPSPPSSPDN